MKAGTMRPYKKLLGLGLIGIIIALYAFPDKIQDPVCKLVITAVLAVSGYLLYISGRQR